MPRVVLVDWKRVRKKYHIDDTLAVFRRVLGDWRLFLLVFVLPAAVLGYIAFVIRPGDPDRAARVMLAETQRLAEEGRLATAQARLEAFIRDHPRHPVVPEAYLRLARYTLDRSAGNPNVADGLRVQGAIRMGARPGNKDRVAALDHDLGLYYLSFERPDLALASLEQVVRDDGGYPGRNPPYYRDLASVLVSIQPSDTAGALAAMDRYIRLVRAGRNEERLLEQRDELAARIEDTGRKLVAIEDAIRLAGPRSRESAALEGRQHELLGLMQADEERLRGLVDELAQSPVPGALADLGEVQVRIGDHEQATVAFLEVLINYPNHRDSVERASFHLGRIAFQGGDYEGAAWRMRPLLESPRQEAIHQEAYYLAGEANRRLGRYRDALELFRFVLHQDVTPLVRFASSVMSSECVFALEDWIGAASSYRAAMDADPALGGREPEAFLAEPAQDVQETVMGLRRRLILGEVREDEEGTARRVSGLLAVADAFVDEGELVRALDVFHRLKAYRAGDAVFPPDEVYFKIAGTYEGLASAALDRGDAEEARRMHLEAARECLRLLDSGVPSPRVKDAWWRAAAQFHEAGHRYAEAEALDHFLEGLLRDDRESEALLLSGRAYQAAGLLEDAARRMEENQARFPGSFFSWESRVGYAECQVSMALDALRAAGAHEEQGQGAEAEGSRRGAARHLDLAAVALRDLVDDPRITPRAAAWRKAIFELAHVQELQGREQDWARTTEVALSYFPDDEEALPIYYRRAALALGERRYAEALDGFQEILDRWDPASRPRDAFLKYAVFHRADCLYALDDLAAAEDAYRRAADFYHQDGLAPWALYQLGNVHRRQGRVDQARDDYALARVVLDSLPAEVTARGPEGLSVEAWRALLSFMGRGLPGTPGG
ncbi:MAG: tetratricopeptide repeat protein [Planctomycetes bacterium]|nr:tetratricopeptide repeat protein [Planctomycetota bacterium]